VVGAARRRSDAAWEAQLAKLKAYKRTHGDCNVPARWAEDPRLARWVKYQRECKKALDRGDPSPRITAAWVAKLDAIGFTWELPNSGGGLSDDAGWEMQLAKLKTYTRSNSDCNVPQGWAEDPRLGHWVGKQRMFKTALDRGEAGEGMTATRAAKLEALGFAWELSAAAISKQNSQVKRNDAAWEAQLAKLKAYRQSHGDCNVPASWAEDEKLGRWVRDQRTKKKMLDRGERSPGMTAARIAVRVVKLEELGFAWQPDQDAWEAQLAKLRQYTRKHGHCNVPQGWAEDPRLGNWIHTQRKRKKKLDRGEPSQGMTAARVAQLETLGFAWELSLGAAWDDTAWETQLAKLKAYKRRHGNCNVPQRWAEDPKLGGWVNMQRCYKKALDRGEASPKMAVARVAKLEALGFAWSPGRW
jgi:hypothetical protein